MTCECSVGSVLELSSKHTLLSCVPSLRSVRLLAVCHDGYLVFVSDGDVRVVWQSILFTSLPRVGLVLSASLSVLFCDAANIATLLRLSPVVLFKHAFTHSVAANGPSRNDAATVSRMQQSLTKAEKSLDAFRAKQKKIYEWLTSQQTDLEVVTGESMHACMDGSCRLLHCRVAIDGCFFLGN